MTYIMENDILSAFRLVKENQNKIINLNTEVKFHYLIDSLEKIFISSPSQEKHEGINTNKQQIEAIIDEIKILYSQQEDAQIKTVDLIIELERLISSFINQYQEYFSTEQSNCFMRLKKIAGMMRASLVTQAMISVIKSLEIEKEINWLEWFEQLKLSFYYV